jgi:hypothetical protein
MRRVTVLEGLAAAVLAGCGGPAGIEPSDFTGLPWSVTLTTRVDCGNGETGQVSTTGQVSFTASAAPGEIETTSQAGCAFRLHVDGSTAALANSPVVCSTTSNGQAFEFSFASYTATTADGHHLTIAAGETEDFGGTRCQLAISGTGTR